VLMGTVERVEAYGAFVRVGPGQTGLVPNAELGTQRGTDYRKAFPSGTELKVLVLAIEEGGRRIRLSHTQALAREEQAEAQAYIQDTSTKSGGFGLTLGDLFRQARRS
jgi:small subunit ribosomal protein S1